MRYILAILLLAGLAVSAGVKVSGEKHETGELTTFYSTMDAGVCAYTPSTVNLLLCLTPSGLSGYSNSDPVGTWDDESASENDMTQATADNKPTCVTSAHEGYSCVRFDGSNDFMMTGSNVITGNDDRTVFYAGTTTTSSSDTFMGVAGGTSNGTEWNFAGDSNKLEIRHWGGHPSWDITCNFDTTSTPFAVIVYEYVNSTKTMKVWVNGTLDTTHTFSAELNTYSAPYNLGRSQREGQYAPVDIVELRVHGAMTAAQREQTENYMLNKYGKD